MAESIMMGSADFKSRKTSVKTYWTFFTHYSPSRFLAMLSIAVLLAAQALTTLRKKLQSLVFNMPFDPKRLGYGGDGVPILKATEIEQIAIEVLEKHCQKVLRKPAMTRQSKS
jgi:hypothetical protein